ncbi:hypothetical protein IFT80_00175 [Pseudomonas sp. CFBP 8771]|uniref:NACHT domain-containing protein n=1 Tax=Pseudomonas sp. CFBP 8771 TaxID=2775285 RepID=UPI00177BB54D|nr:hypothetical protein [Pseudomonas sp. CFBP 8771]MBD8601048.1 hypothetical protein [Pseudomonas sp. CFBP 8771]
MEAITLDKLNSSSFEKLCRTIALAKFGVAGNVFPAGADAGRDFSYSGPIAGYENLGWDGYLVLQAKFKSSLNSGKPNVEWILNQLIKEFSKFEDGNGYLVPEYYIVATNVSLSGADSYSTSLRQGGLAKVEEKLKALCEAHGVKGFDIWGADKIIDLLGMYPAIRSSYSTWLMPGDVLEAIAKKIFNKDEDFSRALKIALIHSLRRDKNVRLKDAGSVSDDQIRSSQVFVDLPASLSNSRLASSFPFVAQVVELAKTVFKPSLNLGGDRKIDNKVVLLGGPGQGKSTASLYLVQLFRSNLLASDSSQMIDGALQDLIGETLQRSCEENIPACLPSRYPFHISLPAYADLVSESKKVGSRKISLMRYAVDELGSITDTDFDVPMFRRWLEGFPCLFVFDGLDEVPPSGERKEIIAAINDFVGELVALDSDYFVMVTSRPQGYNSDLDGVHWTHWNLDDLSSDKAIAYARLLAKSCYRDDPDRQKKITAHLEVSIENPITRRLMLSPLQVTILHMIVDTGGGVPSSRWNIFNDYFEILKRREKAKSGAAQKILDKNIHLIGPIHQRAGLVLHVESERAGQATSHLDNDKFAELIRGYLKTEEYEFRDSLTRESELSELALNRLVLLSAREEGRISFDVRSLQEYMAASALTAASPEVIEFRLHHLAGRSHWQHVFTIAASRCFSEDNLHYLRSVITNIPRQLDVNEAHKVVGRGARLSFELFCDGIAADQPKHRRQLASHAMELLFYGSYHLRLPLSMLSEEHTENLIMEELKQRYLVASSPEVKAAAWNLLVQLAMCGVRPAVYYLGRHWPSNSQDVFEIIRFGVLPVGLSSGLGSIVEVVCSRPLTELAKSASSLIDLCIRGTGYLSEGDNGLEVSSIRNIFSVFNSKNKGFSVWCWFAN